MATSIPLPFKAQIPVTPPPEFQVFMKSPPPHVPEPFSRGIYQTTSTSALHPQEKPARTQPPSQPAPWNLCHPPDHDPFRLPDTNTTTTNPTTTSSPNIASAPTAEATPTAPSSSPPPPFNPDHIAMASRIASYYQQRCHAVAAFQQQRCQAWAHAQRQKCQEMMQAATVIVAWYIRDRIVRRRKRRRRVFRRGLGLRDGGVGTGRGRDGGGDGRVTKGEAVRRWVMGVPVGGAEGKGDSGGGNGDGGAKGRELPVDKDEVDFDMDREVSPDKDTQLFNVADNLIKSHLARIDVPLLGVLSFDESESESESEEEEDELMDYEDEEDDEYEEEEGGETEDGDERDEEIRGRGGGGGKEELASKDAQLGTTTKGSRKRSHSFIS